MLLKTIAADCFWKIPWGIELFTKSQLSQIRFKKRTKNCYQVAGKFSGIPHEMEL